MTDSRPRVTVLAGFSPAATDAVARSLLVTDPTLILVAHDREDVIPTLVRLSRRHPGSDLLLALPPAVEPEAVAAACAMPGAGAVRLDSFVTVVEAAGLLDDLTTTDRLRDRDRHAADDDRAVADVVSRQLEFADTIVVWSSPEIDVLERDRLTALLHRLAPWAAHVRIGDSPMVDCTALAARLLRTGRHDPAVPGMLGRALEGYPIGIHDPAGEHGVNAMLFHSRRPFHPRRLHDVLDDLTSETLRGRGHLWIATQPDAAIGWESSGSGLRLGNLGRWLASLPRERWGEASDMRRLAADANWDPYYGDRTTALSFVGLDLDVEAMTAMLRRCLLTDAEIADGADGWHALPDPFAGYFLADSEPEPAAASRGAAS